MKYKESIDISCAGYAYIVYRISFDHSPVLVQRLYKVRLASTGFACLLNVNDKAYSTRNKVQIEQRKRQFVTYSILPTCYRTLHSWNY